MDPLPEGTHLIHIGPQKTGSTALQTAMHTARSTLAEHGVLYPGPDPRPREAAEVGLGFGRIDGVQNKGQQAWHDLLAQVRDPQYRRVCVSLEAFGRASDEQIERIVSELGGELPHVVAVARRYDSLMPSQWQQRVKSELRQSYDEWLRLVLGEPDLRDPGWRNLWVPHDTVQLMERWAGVVGADNITLIIGDEDDRALVPRTFESMLDLPEGTLRLESGPQNQSLSYSQVEVVRQLNISFQRNGWSHADYHHLIRRGVVPRLLATPMPEGEMRIPPLPTWARQRIVELSDRRIEALAGLAVRVVGDPEKLRVAHADPVHEVPPPADTVAMVTVIQALEGMVLGAERRRRVERKASRRRLAAARRRAARSAASSTSKPTSKPTSGTPSAGSRAKRVVRGAARRLRPGRNG